MQMLSKQLNLHGIVAVFTTVIPLTLAVFFSLACSQPAPPEPTVDIGATVQAAVEKALPTATDTREQGLKATVQAGIAGTMEVLASTPSPTPIPEPTATAIPTDTPTPVPTDTPTPIPTDTPTPIFTTISTATHTPTATHTSVPTARSQLSRFRPTEAQLGKWTREFNDITYWFDYQATYTADCVVAGKLDWTEYESRLLAYSNEMEAVAADVLDGWLDGYTATDINLLISNIHTILQEIERTCQLSLLSTYTSTPVPTDTATPTPTSTNTPLPTPTHTPEPTLGPSLTTADVVQQARAGVVRIEGYTSSGSGFVVDSIGHILTNEHVISGQPRLTVVFDNGERLTPRVIASDATRDIALLRVLAPRALTVLPFATSVREGDEVIALGYPLDISGSMTATKGIVSAFRTASGVSYIQTDTALNPGNSGGPLLNVNGEVIGMNTSVLRDIQGENYSAQGIGFAIKLDVLSDRFEVMKTGQSDIPIPIPTPIPVTTQTPSYLFGPESGWLDSDSDDARFFDSQTNIADFVVDVTFRSPDKMPEDFWFAGLLVRVGENDTNVVGITNSGTWSHERLGRNDVEVLDNGSSFAIKQGSNINNHLSVIVREESGWLFVNGIYVSELDLGEAARLGSVAPIVYGDPGTSRTRFSDFTVRSLSRVYGPIDGAIKHDMPNTGRVDEFQTHTQLTDGIIEARFFNPYRSFDESWTSGFLIRNSTLNGFQVIAITGKGNWFHSERLDNADHILQSGYALSIARSRYGTNRIRLIVLGNEGWLFMYDHYAPDKAPYVVKLDLSRPLQGGFVSIIGSYFLEDGIAGKSTRFEDFTIWSAD